MSRHDYKPFGEELSAGTGGRTSAMGYGSTSENNRKHFTGYERDTETGLDFAQARYYASWQGRFTSIDPLSSSAKLSDPQSFNRYSYVGNNPTAFSDPSGLERGYAGTVPMGADGAANAAMWAAGQSDIAESAAEYMGMIEAAFRGVQETRVTSVIIEEGTEQAAADTNNDNVSEAAPQNPTSLGARDDTDSPQDDRACHIQVRATKIGGIGGYLPLYHAYIVTQSSDEPDVSRVFRAGPDGQSKV